MAEKERKEKLKPSYILVPRKLIIAWLTTSIVIFIGVLGAYQYANYVARQLCGLISISVDTYKNTPPTTEAGRAIAKEFNRISDKYNCA